MGIGQKRVGTWDYAVVAQDCHVPLLVLSDCGTREGQCRDEGSGAACHRGLAVSEKKRERIQQ